MTTATLTADTTAHPGTGYGHREGLEGPFWYCTGAILYYDPSNGHYLDPAKDVYLGHASANFAMGVTVTPPQEQA